MRSGHRVHHLFPGPCPLKQASAPSARSEVQVSWVQLITNGGRSVHPGKVHYRIKDPLEKVDWFQAGAHSIPETEEFLNMIGHFAENDHDLHAFE